MKKIIHILVFNFVCLLLLACNNKAEILPPAAVNETQISNVGRSKTGLEMQLGFFDLVKASKDHGVATFIDNKGDTLLVETTLAASNLKAVAIYGVKLMQASVVTYQSDTTKGSFEYKVYLYATSNKPDFGHDTPISEEVIMREDLNNPLTLAYGAIDRKFRDRQLFDYLNQLENGDVIIGEPSHPAREVFIKCGKGASYSNCMGRAIDKASLECASEGSGTELGATANTPGQNGEGGTALVLFECIKLNAAPKANNPIILKKEKESSK